MSTILDVTRRYCRYLLNEGAISKYDVLLFITEMR